MEIFRDNQAAIFEAFWTTIQLTVFSAIFALILGTVLAAMRLSPVPVMNWIGTAYVNVVRNTPLTLIILFCSFGISQITLQFDLDRDIDGAAQDVQAAINAAGSALPRNLPYPPNYS